jgi:hypothetical protein
MLSTSNIIESPAMQLNFYVGGQGGWAATQQPVFDGTGVISVHINDDNLPQVTCLQTGCEGVPE